MGFYSKLRVETHKFTEFLNCANDGDLGIALMYGVEKSKFMMHASAALQDKKNITKVLEGCIQNELWGFLTFLIVQYSSYSGVKKIILKNYNRIPKEFRASIISVFCYGQKWMDEDLNDLFIDLVADQNAEENNLAEIEDQAEEIEVFYPLGWGESIYTAINNPCWFYSDLDAAAYCLYTKLFYVRNSKIPELQEYISDFNMFGEGELHNIDAIKTRVIKGKIRKKDILAVIQPDELFEEFLPQLNLIQNQSVYDLKELPSSEVKEDETDLLAQIISIENNTVLDFGSDELIDKTFDIYELIEKNCEKFGLPEYVEPSKVQNKEMILPKDVALLIRTRLRATQGNALKVAKDICKTEKNARWIFSSSQGYRAKKNYFYRGLGYSAYSNKVMPVVFQYIAKENINIISTKKILEESNGFLEVFAIDYSTESKTIEDFFKKFLPSEEKKESNDNPTEIKKAKELTIEEKEKLKKDYVSSIDEDYQKKLQSHKDAAEFKSAENSKLQLIIEEQNRKIQDLERQLAKKQAIIDKQESVSILSLGYEKEKYDGETHSMVMSALRHELKNCERDTRRYDVIASIIEKNAEETDPISEKLKEIKQLTKGYRIASEISKGLEEQGLEVVPDGKHPKIKFSADDRYQITAASTSSDRRAGENLYALIKKKFF